SDNDRTLRRSQDDGAARRLQPAADHHAGHGRRAVPDPETERAADVGRYHRAGADRHGITGERERGRLQLGALRLRQHREPPEPGDRGSRDEAGDVDARQIHAERNLRDRGPFGNDQIAGGRNGNPMEAAIGKQRFGQMDDARIGRRLAADLDRRSGADGDAAAGTGRVAAQIDILQAFSADADDLACIADLQAGLAVPNLVPAAARDIEHGPRLDLRFNELTAAAFDHRRQDRGAVDRFVDPLAAEIDGPLRTERQALRLEKTDAAAWDADRAVDPELLGIAVDGVGDDREAAAGR